MAGSAFYVRTLRARLQDFQIGSRTDAAQSAAQTSPTILLSAGDPLYLNQIVFVSALREHRQQSYRAEHLL